VRHYRKLSASTLLGREYFMVPQFMIARNTPQLFSFPGGTPGNGYSGRYELILDTRFTRGYLDFITGLPMRRIILIPMEAVISPDRMAV
jgi:hypothetical protein